MPKTKKRSTALKIILLVLAALVLLAAIITGMCLFVERHATQTVAEYQDSFSGVAIQVSEDGGVALLPQSGAKNTGVIFYVGAQIEPEAYIPLLSRLAERGYACFIPNLACNTALLEPDAAAPIIAAHPEIKSWYLAGHSLGGYAASGFAADHREVVSGLIFLAAYTSRDLSGADFPLLSVFGDADGVLNTDLYQKLLPQNPTDFEEHILPGANHAQFGDYGAQPRDNDAAITSEQQQAQTAEIILDWLTRHTPAT